MSISGNEETLPAGDTAVATDDDATAPEAEGARGVIGGKVGRFEILGTLGAGGMGVVLAARDPKLDRKVAIKLLHPTTWGDTGGQDALEREAQGMAKLAHPNVVAVYDVGRAGDQTFVAMELIEGTNLGEWLRAAPRTWRAIVGVFLGAGRGLAAAHAAGLVHRDVKPGNILVGNDGRVRIGDFGLVTTGRASEGSVAGTLAYMAPEQLEGAPLDARADQFAFCVALYEALYGVRPFAGATVTGRKAAIAAGITRPSAKAVPSRISDAVLRGLRAAPADRWPSMSALVDVLADDPRARRRWIAAGGALVGMAAVATWALMRPTTTADPCASGPEQLAGVWDADRQASVRAAFDATKAPYAADTWTRVRATIDQYTGRWIAMHGAACRATRVDGTQSDTLMDLRMACLERARAGLGALTARWQASADPSVVASALAATAELAPIDACADQRALTAVAPLPSDPAAVTAIAATRRDLDDAAALYAIGQYGPAKTTAIAARNAAAGIGWPQLQAEAAFMLGRVLTKLGDPAAEPPLVEASRLASATRDDRLAARAQITLVGVLGDAESAGDRALLVADLADGIVARAGSPEDLRGQLAAERGAAYITLARWDDARTALLDARARLTQALGADSPEVIRLVDELARTADGAGHYDEARALGEEALVATIRVDGPSHPAVGTVLHNLGKTAEAAGDLPGARAYLARALELKQRALGPDTISVATTIHNIATVATKQGQLDDAATMFQREIEIRERIVGHDHASIAPAIGNLAVVRHRQGRIDEALALANRALTIKIASKGPEHPSVAISLSLIGGLQEERGDIAGALATYDRELAIDTKALGPEHPTTLTCHSEIAEVLIRTKRWREALPHLAIAIAGLTKSAPDQVDLAQALGYQGQCQTALGAPKDAIRSLTQAIAIEDKAEAALLERGQMRQLLAQAQWNAGDRRGAMATARAAEQQLASGGEQAAADLAETRAWLTDRARAGM
jgi:tetratricopeptide (TPR) repeat protein/predicted Ser/Thr protein kinase